MKSFERIFHWVFLAVVVVYLASVAARSSRNKNDFDLIAFGNVPVQTGGRVKPVDTLARNSLYAINHKATFLEETIEADGSTTTTKQPATRWFADMLFDEERARQHKIFRIVNDDVLHSLGLKARKGLRYSFDELQLPRQQKFFKWLSEVKRKEQIQQSGGKVELSVADEQVSELDKKLQTFLRIQSICELPTGSKKLTQGEVRDWLEIIVRQSQRDAGRVPRLIPNEVDPEKDWLLINEVTFPAVGQLMQKNRGVLNALTDKTISPDKFVEDTFAEAADGGWLAMLWEMRNAYVGGDPAAFNEAVSRYAVNVKETNSSVSTRLPTESFVNRFEPFYQCVVLIVLAMLLLVGSWIGWRKPLLRAALVVTLVAVTVHTFGLFARMYLEDRPFVFVTNLYSSAVFIGWLVVLLGLFLEWIYRNSIGLTVACVVSFLSLVIAHLLDVAGGGQDNMQVMQAVLDTNFWLATHVTIVTFGYAATFIAGFLGIAYIVVGIFTPALDKELSKNLGRMTYGVLCGALMLSFIGTVLGGIWADQSWGRFWGWDPKENGALNIVMWNALILHARWGGMVRARGIAVLAVLGNIVTTWSWFGTNMLGVGLHSYGKMDRAFIIMTAFMATQLAIAAAGAFWPTKSWLSYEAMTQGPPKRRDGKRISKLDQTAPA